LKEHLRRRDGYDGHGSRLDMREECWRARDRCHIRQGVFGIGTRELLIGEAEHLVADGHPRDSRAEVALAFPD
jgi:hypothetical protein